MRAAFFNSGPKFRLTSFYGALEGDEAQFHFNYEPVVAHSTAHSSPVDLQIIDLKFKQT